MNKDIFSGVKSGFYWAHVNGPDSLDVLLIKYDDRTQTAIVCDDAFTPYKIEPCYLPFSNGNWIHKWYIYFLEPVIRPDPIRRDLWDEK